MINHIQANETHKGFLEGEPNSNGKDCWGCGHWLIGGNCWKNSNFSMNIADGWRATNPGDSCEEWVIEDTVGTITGEIAKHIKEGESREYDA